jgi:GTA TIM-barrel-like domain/Putative phage tail protein
MASMILSSAGNAAFGPIGGFLGAIAGTAIDNAAITALTPARVQPSRLAGLKVQASQEGAPIPVVYGRFRVAGQVIWASKFHEVNKKRTVGGKGGQRVVERSYTISFAIGLAEGPIDGLGRVWLNGDLLDLSTLAHRIYLGGESQMPDPSIEAVEGLTDAPAFRGLAYIVFEDFAVSAYGDRIPQFAFEVMASPRVDASNASSLANLTRGVCLIPGAGEFVYATTPIREIRGPGEEVGVNLHVQAARSDFEVSLDNLARDFPNVDSVSLVVAWFGTDLRAGQCQILPKVEGSTKQTSPRQWHVAGLTRGNAQTVSQADGKPAYGGSPDDQSVVEAILALKSRGHKVTHNPFVMMDIPSVNSLPNPLGGASQPAYPWRGRITCFPGIGQPSSVDATTTATAQITAFFGSANASHFTITAGKVAYAGPNEWSYRRFILHQAALCVAAGGVEAFLIGSELIGLTRVRGVAGSFPAVGALMALAGQVRALVGPLVKISYGADWTEYGAYQPPGTNDVRFPLDPLWASANVDFIGLDWYAPLTDRRDGGPRPDVATFQAGIEGGEAYEFYYANDAARLAKSRTPITDGAYNEPWVWRQKDLRGFWSNAHYERTNGIRASTPTSWVPQSKPLALMELGFPAVDKGANRPSVFPDPKSVEAGLPPFSSGARDDVEQRLALEATLSYWRDHNLPSNIYAGDMMDMSRCHLWAWDARPFPHFPGLTNVWADGAYAMLGHWLSGRAGALSLAALVRDLCHRSGLMDVNVDGVSGYVDGFAIETPSSGRSILESLFVVMGLEAVSRPNSLVIHDARKPIGDTSLVDANIIARDGVLSLARTNHAIAAPSQVRFSCYGSERDYQPATQISPATGQSGPVMALASNLVLDPIARHHIANRLAASVSSDSLAVSLSPALSAQLEVGDRIALQDGAVWRVDRCEGQLSQTLTASRATTASPYPLSYSPADIPAQPILVSPPILVVLDITAPFTSATLPKPLVGCTSAGWAGDIEVAIGGQVLGHVHKAMTYATVIAPIHAGPVGRLIGTPLTLSVKFGAILPQSGQAALLQNGLVADIISWRDAVLIGPDLWRIGPYVRGLGGASAGVALPSDTPFVLMDDALVEMAIDPALVGSSLAWQARPLSDTAQTTTQTIGFSARALRPWPPTKPRAKRTGAGVKLSWTRRGRGNGDAWSTTNAPLGASLERYRLDILATNGTVLRTAVCPGTDYTYAGADEIADFGSVQNQLNLSIRQIGDDDLEGTPLEVIVGVSG